MVLFWVIKKIFLFGLDVRFVIFMLDGYIVNRFVILKGFVEFFGFFVIFFIDVGLCILIISFCLFRKFEY